MLAHVVAVLREFADEVVVVGSAELALPEVDARVVVDREPHKGPLAGIREGLAAIRCERAYVTSTDAPFLTADFARALLAFGGPAAPEVGGFVQSLAAVLPRSAEAEAGRLIAAGRTSAHGLLEALGFRRVLADELPGLEPLRSLDTPEAYLEAVRAGDPGAWAQVEFRGSSARVPIGTLGEVLELAVPGIGSCVGGRVPEAFRVSIAGLCPARDARAPVGPGERVIVREEEG
jgi:molybdopterin-guanine dinucleotide biosynthesis protein A